jgi:endonuclease/exonuclease/phosphatase family metal-dependent hydrolase
MYKLVVFGCLFLLVLIGNAQDTLTVMHYNLLAYGNFTSYCTSNNNNPNQKDAYIKTIVQHIKPDILTVNEMSSSATYQTRLLNNALNVDGETKYKRATISNTAGSDIVNMIYYNSEKLSLKQSYVAQSNVRDIDIFKLYYKGSNFAEDDTIYIHCMVAHLKAGNTTSDETQRGIMASAAMAYYKKHFKAGNFMSMGDFNLYTFQEPAYQNFTNFIYPDYSFIDPVQREGNWNNNSSFKDVHTQSTHTNGDCFSSGGMDDRFDFILASHSIINGKASVKYIPESYWAIGQDGKHYNKNLVDMPQNTTVPTEVLSALYQNSDHLPVMLKLLVDKSLAINTIPSFDYINIPNPIQHSISVDLSSPQSQWLNVSLFDISGRLLLRATHKSPDGLYQLRLPCAGLKNGLYLLQLNDEDGRTHNQKIIIQQ